MGENKEKNKKHTEKKEEKKQENKKEKLSVDSTVLLSLAGASLFIVVARVVYYLITGI